MANKKFWFLSLLFLCGCFRSYHIRENLSEKQVLDCAVIRRPTGEKALGLVPVYEDILEGYIRGGLTGADGQGIQGVKVNFYDDKGTEVPGFTAGVSDNFGIYKIRFSLPIRWNRIDFKGTLSCGPDWKIVTPQPTYRFYFNRRNGILSYTSVEGWTTVQNEQSKPRLKIRPASIEKAAPQTSPATAVPKDEKKGEDFFGDFNFGQ